MKHVAFLILLAVAALAGEPLWIVAATGAPIPTLDLSGDTTRQVVIAQGTPDTYQGHPTTLLLPDGKTMFCVWTQGHGGPCGPMKRSDDAGKTWSELLSVPDNWKQSRNCPAIYRLTDPQGVTRLVIFAGQGPGGTRQPDNGTMQRSVSLDDGKTWSPMQSVDLECVMPFCTIVPVENGKKLIGLTNIRRPGELKDKRSNVVTQSESTDGGLTWSPWRILVDLGDLKPCEPEVVRSPDGRQLLCLIRENIRTEPAHFITSDDEAKTWSEVKALPPGLHGDRHKAAYAKDGRLVVCFRDTGRDSPTKNHFVAWVGRYEDIVGGRDGEYKIKLLHSHKAGDCGYPGLELLPDGTFVATTYVKYRPGPEQNSVVSTRFTLSEADKAKKVAAAPVERKAASILLDDTEAKFSGEWKVANKLTPLVGPSYRHDDRAKKAPATAKFTPEIPEAGRYEVRLLYVASSNRASKVAIAIHSAEGDKKVSLNQRESCLEDGIPRALGVFAFAQGKEGSIEISNAEADGFVVVDALQLVPEAEAVAERNTRTDAGFSGKSTKPAVAVKIPPPMVLKSAPKPADVDGKPNALVDIGGTPESPPAWAARTPGGATGKVVVPAPKEPRFAHLSWPKAVRVQDGTIVLAYIAGAFHGTHGGGSPAVSISTDGGRTFSPPQVLREFAKGKDYTQSGNLALGVAADGALVLLAMAFDDDAGNNIFGWRSTDSGRTWTTTDTSALGPDKTGSVFGSIIEVPGRGLTALGHYRAPSKPHGKGIWMASSKDAGRSWGEAVQITDVSAVEPALIRTEDRLIAFLRGKSMAGTQFVSVSDDGGMTWKTERSVLGPESGEPYNLAAPCAVVNPQKPSEVFVLTTERSKTDLPGRIWLWKGDARRLDWQRERVLLEFPKDKAQNDLGYPWLVHVEGRRWLMFYYHGHVHGTNSIWSVEVELR